MDAESPLSAEFVRRYPVEAARVLERLSGDDVAALFNAMPPELMGALIASMLPESAALCIQTMEDAAAAKLLVEMPLTHSARIFRMFPKATQQRLGTLLPKKTRHDLQGVLNYGLLSVGNLMDPVVNMLPEEISVAEAIRRIERFHHPASSELYIVDEHHHLQGVIDLGQLLISNHHSRLKDIMNKKSQPLFAHMEIGSSLRQHPGWASRRSLPVVERDNTLIGILAYSRLQDGANFNANHVHLPTDGLLSLGKLYWLCMAQLLNNLFSLFSAGKIAYGR